MVQEVWLHIGTPKSGTSSLQKHLAAHRDALAEQGLAYLSPQGRDSANELAVAWNQNRSAQVADLAGAINQAIETRPQPRALISSEMFYGFAPDTMFHLFPAMRGKPLKVLVYLRRQDRYIEAKFLQKSKNGRFRGTIADYIAKFDGSGSDYAAELALWQQEDGVQLIPRILERGKLTGGDVVSDALQQIGLPAPEPGAEPDVNVSPGLHRVQLLQAAFRADIVPPRRLQRALAVHYPQDPADRAPILTQQERRAYLAQFSAGNESLRARYHPEYDSLFDTQDLHDPDVETGIPPFTEAQLLEVTRLLKTMKQLL